MDQINHTGLISGMNDISQLETAVKSAQKMVGSATMQLDPEALEHAQNAINDAKEIMNRSTETGVDQEFISEQKKLLEQCEHQLIEAKQ